jgi:glycosyltransferase involved in cell wall biosynthesis
MCPHSKFLPEITVVTVTRNDAPALQHTIESVRQQDYPNIHHIIVDGGSTDGTSALLQQHQRENLRWISEPDDGIYDAMNKGVLMSSGHWIIFLNAGDTFHRADVVSEIFDRQSPDADLIYGDTIFIDGDRAELIKARAAEFLWQAMIFNHNSLFTRRSVLLEHPFVDQYRIVADSEFVIWAFQSGKTFHNSGITVNTYRRGGFSDVNSVLRTVERWKLVSDKRMKPTHEINDYYFQRLLWEDSCKSYLEKQYNVSI